MKIVIEAMPPRVMKICKQRGRVYVCTLSVSIDGATQSSSSLLRLCMNRKYVSTFVIVLYMYAHAMKAELRNLDNRKNWLTQWMIYLFYVP